jgi:hypothetical protein
MLASFLSASNYCVSAPEAQFKFPLLKDELFLDEDRERLRNDFRFSLWQNNDLLEQIPSERLKKYEVFESLIANRFEGKEFSYFIDHTPINFSYYHELKLFYPKAKFIHIVRDGRAVYNSFKTLTWGPKDPIRAADWWLRKIGLGMAPLAIGDNIYTISYEDLVMAPEETMSNLCNWLGIAFDEMMLEGTSGFLPKYTKTQHKLVGQGVSISRMDSWKKGLTDKEIAIFQQRAGYLLKALGYELKDVAFKDNKFSLLIIYIKGWFLAKRQIKKQKSKELKYQKISNN